ncbi:hypothetical protein J437_LFUL005644 [Ladona fulva]|uniref:Uncharacterized protein n=1 Tax=Ladona fulva TaxID=123851 RepID=A0A8K0K233_LADFU|nr:hypothetical protein J437_LFUL005644 [Ladona fulva]
MATLPRSKRIQYLRKKNRNLLEKLETHSSEIHKELRKLKESTRGQRLRSHNIAKDESHSKAWVKRNGSKQVFESLCHSESELVNDMNLSQHSSIITDEVQRKSNIAKVNDKNLKSTTQCRCAFSQSEDSLSQKIIEANREILSSIDYSPKSIFLRRMKSKYLSRCYCGKNINEKKAKEHIAHLEPSSSSVSSPSKEESLSSCKSSVLGNKFASKEEGTDFERLKKFRYLNWTDCHAENDGDSLDSNMESKQKPVSLSSAQHKWREKYRINERLFAEPTGLSCKNLVRCSHCLDKSTVACGSNTNEVVVTIPSSLLDISNSAIDGKRDKLKKRGTAMKLLTKRPKPCNSMALRYQKGII